MFVLENFSIDNQDNDHCSFHAEWARRAAMRDAGTYRAMISRKLLSRLRESDNENRLYRSSLYLNAKLVPCLTLG